MKKYFFVFAASLMMGGCDHSDHNHGGTPLTGGKNFYGENFDPAGAVTVDSTMALLGTADSAAVKVSGKVFATCSGEGCWLELKMANGDAMFIDTGHKFHVPTSGAEGLNCVVSGVAKKEMTDEGKEDVYILAKGLMIEGYTPKEGGDTSKAEHNHEECKSHTEEGEEHTH